MFPTVNYILNALTLNFPRYIQIRRKAIDFEDKLRGIYSAAQVNPVPDELDPGIPRILFDSDHGFSHISISQTNIVLEVRYSEDWQVEIEKGKQYLFEKNNLLYELLDLIELKPSFSGVSTVVRLPSTDNDKDILGYLSGKLLKDSSESNKLEVLIKNTNIIDSKFYSHVTVKNYKDYNLKYDGVNIPRFIDDHVVEKGVEISGDFNDRYLYNLNGDYQSAREDAPVLIERALEYIAQSVAFVKG